MKTIAKFFKQTLNVKGGLLKTSLVMSFILPTLISLSTNLPLTTPGSSDTEKTIKNYFKFPQVLLPHAEQKVVESKKVEVLFTTDSYGKVNFALAKTDDKLLKGEVEKQFYKLSLPKVSNDVVHSVVLNFKTM